MTVSQDNAGEVNIASTIAPAGLGAQFPTAINSTIPRYLGFALQSWRLPPT